MTEIPETDEPIALQGGEVHFRVFDLETGDFLHVLVDQQGIDVVLRLFDPHGEELGTVDSPNGKDGYEELVTIVRETGRYRFEVASLEEDAPPGHYRVVKVEHRPATDDDQTFVAAELAYWDGAAQFQKRDYEAAVDSYRQALPIWTRLDLPRQKIDTLHGLCRARISLGELPEATAFCEEALDLFRGQEDQRGMDVLLDRAGWIRLRRGQPERAIPLCEEALTSFEVRGFDRGAAMALSHLGTAYHNLGRTQLALDAFERALPANARKGNERSEASIRNDLANVLLDLHRPREAYDHSLRVVEIQRGYDDRKRLALALEGLALAAVRLEEPKAAEKAIAEALDLAGADTTLSTLHSTRGLIRQRNGEAELARESYKTALAIARETGDRHAEGWILARIGLLDVETGQPALGLERFQEASAIFVEIGERRGQAVTDLRSGEALRDQGELEKAWKRMEPALDFVEETRRTTERRDIRTDYFAFRQDYYEIATDVLMRLHDEKPTDGHDRTAFVVNERRLARELDDTLTVRRSLARLEVDPALLAEERQLERKLSDASLLSRKDPRRESRIRKLVKGLRQVGGKIRHEVFDDPSSKRPMIDVEAVGEALDEGTLLLVYALGQRRSFLWSLSGKVFVAHELPPRSEIERLATAFSSKLARSDVQSQSTARHDGRRLSEILLAPVASQLAAHERLALVTEGELQVVPFTALPEPGGDDDAFLVRRYEIVVLPSTMALDTLRQARAARPSPPLRLALFADPVFRADDPRVDGGSPEEHTNEEDVDLRRSGERLGVDPYARLPHTRQEVERIRELYGGDVFLGFAANRETFLGPEIRRYSGLHVASHALVDREVPALSGLVLSLVDPQGRRQNGFVRAFEISRLDLAADLVVLSACRTGRGRDLRGEGVQALSRAFLDAGAARVVFSLWEVSDRHTAELMSRFYKALSANDTPAAALRQAQVSMLAKPDAAPYQWAGFVLVGDWRRLEHGRGE